MSTATSNLKQPANEINKLEQMQDEQQTSSEEEDQMINSQEIQVKEDTSELDRIFLKEIIEKEDFFQKVIQMNDQAALKLKNNLQQEALSLLFKTEKILEFAATCGKSIDRNLIIVVLYNKACAYQGLWILDKCSKYIDGVIFNLENSLQEEDQRDKKNKNKLTKEKEREQLSYKIKKQTFLVKSYMQHSAIYSQLGQHKDAFVTAQKSVDLIRQIFKISYDYCKQMQKEYSTANTNSSSTPMQKQKSQNYFSNNKKQQQHTSQQNVQQAQQQILNNNQINVINSTNIINNNNNYLTVDYASNISITSQNNNQNQAKEEIFFSKYLVDNAVKMLEGLANIQTIQEQLSTEVNSFQQLNEAKKSLYFWKNNPENNERHIRQELQALKPNENETRGLLGVQNDSEWIENFNIGTIMHMQAQSYEDFTYFGDFMYEISKKSILERIIFLSISYFTIATEMRFLEIDKFQGKNPEQILESPNFKKSENFHLKSIQIVCQSISIKSPFINHLISSYHKHYNQNLETIQEEISIVSLSNLEDKNIFENNNNNQQSAKANQLKYDKMQQNQNEKINNSNSNGNNSNVNNNNSIQQNSNNNSGQKQAQNQNLAQEQQQQQFYKNQIHFDFENEQLIFNNLEIPYKFDSNIPISNGTNTYNNNNNNNNNKTKNQQLKSNTNKQASSNNKKVSNLNLNFLNEEIKQNNWQTHSSSLKNTPRGDSLEHDVKKITLNITSDKRDSQRPQSSKNSQEKQIDGFFKKNLKTDVDINQISNNLKSVQKALKLKNDVLQKNQKVTSSSGQKALKKQEQFEKLNQYSLNAETPQLASQEELLLKDEIVIQRPSSQQNNAKQKIDKKTQKNILTLNNFMKKNSNKQTSQNEKLNQCKTDRNFNAKNFQIEDFKLLQQLKFSIEKQSMNKILQSMVKKLDKPGLQSANQIKKQQQQLNSQTQQNQIQVLKDQTLQQATKQCNQIEKQENLKNLVAVNNNQVLNNNNNNNNMLIQNNASKKQNNLNALSNANSTITKKEKAYLFDDKDLFNKISIPKLNLDKISQKIVQPKSPNSSSRNQKKGGQTNYQRIF